MKRLRQLKEIAINNAIELQRLNENLERLQQNFDIVYDVSQPDDYHEEENPVYIVEGSNLKPTKEDIEKMQMACSNLSKDQLFILLNSFEDKQLFEYAQVCKDRIMDLQTFEQHQVKINKLLGK